MIYLGVLGLTALAGCASLKPSAEELNDPNKALHVTVRSIPPGAEVYGMQGDSAGTYCGTTPFTFKYVLRKTATGPEIFGTLPEETITNAGADLLDLDRFSYTFRCLVELEGYEPYRVNEVLDQRKDFNPRDLNTSRVFEGGQTKTITVTLTPESSE